MLTKKQFDLLDFVAENDFVTVAEAAKQLKYAKAELQAVYDECTEQGYVKGLEITEKGLEALEPYRVKRAVFMAAGFGSRMVPVTLNTPKPLVRVHGVRMIDTLLDAVIAAGIEEIYIVRGYLAEQFDQLLYKYPMVKFIENPLYDKGNNVVSLNFAGELLRNAYVLESDLILSNPKLITKYQYESNYLTVPTEHTDDWCFTLDEDGYIDSVGIGGDDCYQIIGISYWTDEYGARFARDIAEVCKTPEGMKSFMSYVPLVYHKGEYKIRVRECRFEDVVEIDSFRELCEKDPAYKID